MNNQLLQTLGFFLEIASFMSAGYYLARGKPIIFFAFASIGIVIAVYVGELIKKQALENEKNNRSS